MESQMNESVMSNSETLKREEEVCKFGKQNPIVMTDIKVLEEKLRVSEGNNSDIEYAIQEYTKNIKKLYEPYFDKLKNDCNTFLTSMMNVQENLTVDLESKQFLIDTLNQNVFLQNLLKDKDLVIGKKCAELKESMAYLAELEKDILKYNIERKLAEEEKLSLLTKNEGLSKLLNEKDTEITNKITEIGLLKSNHRSTLSLQLEIGKLKQDILRRDESILDLKNQLTSTGNKLNGVTNQLIELSGLKSVNTILENKVADLQKELNTLLRSSSKLRTDHLHLKRQSLHDLHRNLSSIIDEDNDTSDSSENTVKELKTTRKMLEEKIIEVNTLPSETFEKNNKKSDANEDVDNNMLIKVQVQCDVEHEQIRVECESGIAALKEQLNVTQKEFEKLKAKYDEIEALSTGCIESCKELSCDFFLLEAEIKNLQEQIKDEKELKILSPGCAIRKKRESVHDYKSFSTTDTSEYQSVHDYKSFSTTDTSEYQSVHDYNSFSTTDTSFDMLTSAEIAAACVECKKLRTIIEQDKCIKENEILKLKLIHIKQYIRNLKVALRK